MNPRAVTRDYLLLLALALLVRLLAAWPQQQPNYMDAAYYYVNAAALAEGRGLVEDFVWNYLGDPQPPPQPAFQYWMPLTSLLAAAGMVLGGVNYRAAQAGLVLAAALLPLVSYRAAWLLSGQRWLSWLAGLLTIFSGFYFPFWTAIDNFAPFGLAGALALLLAGEAHNSQFAMHNSKLFLAGVMAGLAHLARADGLLLLIAIELYFGWGVLSRIQPASRQKLRITNYELRAVTLPILGYLVVMLPWFARNWQALGALLPVAGTQTIWLTGYDDLFSYGRELSARTFWAQGWAEIARGRWWAFTANVQTVFAVWGLIFLTPLAAVGGWARRRHALIQLPALYAALLFAAMTLLFAFPGARGGLFHSGAALLPFINGAAVVGLDSAVEWAARRRRRWHGPTAKRFFAAGLLLLAVSLSSFLYYQRVLRNNAWNSADGLYPAIAAWVAAEAPGATVMIGNPPAYRYHGGGLSVVIPNENLPTTLAAARQFGARYLVLDRNHPAPLTEVFENPTSQPGLSLVQQFGEVLVFEVAR